MLKRHDNVQCVLWLYGSNSPIIVQNGSREDNLQSSILSNDGIISSELLEVLQRSSRPKITDEAV